jgi:hypothetical protein
MNDRRSLPDHLPAGLTKPELLQSLLIYDPVQHSKGVNIDQALQARLFFNFLGPSPEPKPWIREWISKVEALRKRATAELGAELRSTSDPGGKTVRSNSGGVGETGEIGEDTWTPPAGLAQIPMV